MPPIYPKSVITSSTGTTACFNSPSTKHSESIQPAPGIEAFQKASLIQALPPPQHPSVRRKKTGGMSAPPGPSAPQFATQPNEFQQPQRMPDEVWTANVAATKGPLPSLVFAIPFPEPGPTHRTTKKTPLFLLYSMPRANYLKPVDLPDGKKGKEAIIKKVERLWQQELQESQDIKTGKIENPSNWKKFKGSILRTAAKALQWMPDSNIEALGRLPPGKKIGLITVVYPHEADEVSTSKSIGRQPWEVKHGLDDILRRTRRRALLKTSISGILLPVTAAIDFFCIVPLFIFEINIVYFTLQINGARKVATLSKANKAAQPPRAPRKRKLMSRLRRKTEAEAEAENELEQPTSPPLPDETIPGELFNVQKSRPNVFGPVMAHLYALCAAKNPTAFPPKPNGQLTPALRPNRPMVENMIAAFKDWVPADVALRHNLDPDVVAKDLGRCMKKATQEYFRTLKKVKTE